MEMTFHPPRRAGLALQMALILMSLLGSVWNLNQATHTPVGPVFIGYLAGFVGLTLPVPVFAYALYGLLRSSYRIRQDSLRLAWGLRVEDIPLVDITWVRLQSELDGRLPLPLFRWPGAVTGVRRLHRSTPVEFMASRSSGLVLVETSRRAFAISPEDPVAFLHSFQRMAELGSLEAVPGLSIRPGEVVGSAWESLPARALLALALVLAAGFAAWSLLELDVPQGARLPLGDTGRFVNRTQLTLLPVLNSLYFLFDLVVGLFFFRREETRPLAYLLWISSVLVSALFFAAVLGLAG